MFGSGWFNVESADVDLYMDSGGNAYELDMER